MIFTGKIYIRDLIAHSYLNFCVARRLQLAIDNLSDPGWENDGRDNCNCDSVEERPLKMRKSEIVGKHRDTDNIDKSGDDFAYHHGPDRKSVV